MMSTTEHAPLRQFVEELRRLARDIESEYFAADQELDHYRTAVEAFNDKLAEVGRYLQEAEIETDLADLAPLPRPGLDDCGDLDAIIAPLSNLT
jgi:hypothetical protein